MRVARPFFQRSGASIVKEVEFWPKSINFDDELVSAVSNMIYEERISNFHHIERGAAGAE